MMLKIVGLLLVLLVAQQSYGLGQEDFGPNTDIAANYTDWPGVLDLLNSPARVYHTWVNGNEQFYYSGDERAFNTALKQLAAIEAKTHELIIKPGPGQASTFASSRQVSCDWDLHLFGGIARYLTTLNGGSDVWSPYPTLTLHYRDGFALNQLVIPPGVRIVSSQELAARVAKGFASTEKTVRGWACGELLQVDPTSPDNAVLIAKMLSDPDPWVALNAASALPAFGAQAKPTLPALRAALVTNDAELKKQAQAAIDSIEKAVPDPVSLAEHQRQLEILRAYTRILQK